MSNEDKPKKRKVVYCGEIKCKGACIARQGAHGERVMCPFGALPRRSKEERLADEEEDQLLTS